MRKKLAPLNISESIITEVDSTLGIEHELHDPDGNSIGICRRAFDVAYQQRPVPIRHIALYTPNPQRMADFYCKVLDMKEVERTDRSSIFVSDGYFNLALCINARKSPWDSIILASMLEATTRCKRGRKRPEFAAARRVLSEFRSPSIAYTIRGERHRYFAEGMASLEEKVP